MDPNVETAVNRSIFLCEFSHNSFARLRCQRGGHWLRRIFLAARSVLQNSLVHRVVRADRSQQYESNYSYDPLATSSVIGSDRPAFGQTTQSTQYFLQAILLVCPGVIGHLGRSRTRRPCARLLRSSTRSLFLARHLEPHAHPQSSSLPS